MSWRRVGTIWAVAAGLAGLPASGRAAEEAPVAVAPVAAPAAGDDGGPATAPGEKDLERYRAAARALGAAADVEQLLDAMEVLRKGFPDSRPVLHELAERGPRQAKSFALRVLGERGAAEEDLEVTIEGLSDPDTKVRLAAAMAIRRLGEGNEEGFEALTSYLPRELDANNRKMAVKTLQHWKYADSVPLLVRMLRSEKDRGVRNFLVTALEQITRRRYGDDIQRWERYLEEMELKEQARALLGDQNELLRKVETEKETPK